MERLWTKPFIQMTVVALFLFTALYLLLPTLPLFIKQLGGSESQVGLAAGVFTLSAVIFRRSSEGCWIDTAGDHLFYGVCFSSYCRCICMTG